MVERLTENVLLMGNGYFNFYVVGQEKAALIEGGTRAAAKIFAGQWKQLDKKPDIKYIVAPHTHFDHICGIPVMKELFPDAEVVASAVGKKLLTKERIVKDLFRNDAFVSESYFKHGLIDEKPDTSELAQVAVDITVGDGDTLELGGGLKLKILDAPGHSVCSIAAYLEGEQVMFASDAAGFPLDKATVAPTYYHDYGSYEKTIQKLMEYPTRIVGVGHGEILRGDEVKWFYEESLKAARESVSEIQEMIKAGEKQEDIARKLFQRFIQGGPSYYPVEMMMGAMNLLVNNAKAQI